MTQSHAELQPSHPSTGLPGSVIAPRSKGTVPGEQRQTPAGLAGGQEASCLTLLEHRILPLKPEEQAPRAYLLFGFKTSL